MSQTQTTPKKSTAHIFLACLLLFGVPAGVCTYKGDLVTGIALATVGLSCYMGYRTGAIRALASVGGIVAAVYFAPQWLPSVEPVLAEWLPVSGLLKRGVLLGLIGMAIVVTVLLIGSLIRRLFLSTDGRGAANGLNRWGGLLLFGGEAAVGIALLLGGILILSPERDDLQLPPDSASLQQRLSHQIDVVAAKTRSGAIGGVLEKHNPFVKFPQLNKFKEIQQTVRTISDPAAMKQVIIHPRIKELQDCPSAQTAITNLKADKMVQEIIGSGEPLDRTKLMNLLNSQVIMDLLDEPDFVAQASAIIEELNLSDGDSSAEENRSL